MEAACKEGNSVPQVVGVSKIPGEPAVVINGVPPITVRDEDLVLCETISNIESHQNIIFGEWLVGRKVQKKFGDRLFSGEVTEFYKETGWYRVVYEDCDFEDLEWHELQELLLPLDITIPLKTLASKVIKRR